MSTHRFVEKKKCPVCGANIVTDLFAKHVERHGGKTATELLDSASAQREMIDRINQEAVARQTAIEKSCIEMASRPRHQPVDYIGRAKSSIVSAVLVASKFQDDDIDSVLYLLTKAGSISNSPKSIADARSATAKAMSLINRIDYSNFSEEKVNAFDEVLRAAEKAEKDTHFYEASRDAASTLAEIDFVIACIDAGACPSFGAIDRVGLLDRRDSMLSGKTGVHRYR